MGEQAKRAISASPYLWPARRRSPISWQVRILLVTMRPASKQRRSVKGSTAASPHRLLHSRNCCAQRPASRPASGDMGIALVTVQAGRYPCSVGERGERAKDSHGMLLTWLTWHAIHTGEKSAAEPFNTATRAMRALPTWYSWSYFCWSRAGGGRREAAMAVMNTSSSWLFISADNPESLRSSGTIKVRPAFE
jgi:hypothetical protein